MHLVEGDEEARREAGEDGGDGGAAEPAWRRAPARSVTTHKASKAGDSHTDAYRRETHSRFTGACPSQAL